MLMSSTMSYYRNDRNIGRKTSKIKWLFESNLILSIENALQVLGSIHFIPGLQLQRQLNYTKCLVPDASNAQNRALKKNRSWIQILDMALQGHTKKPKQGDQREKYYLPFFLFKCVISKQYIIGKISGINCWKTKS